ncbi:MAG: hypothetical protein U0894_05390 [Pirellulales bacterium]
MSLHPQLTSVNIETLEAMKSALESIVTTEIEMQESSDTRQLLKYLSMEKPKV